MLLAGDFRGSEPVSCPPASPPIPHPLLSKVLSCTGGNEQSAGNAAGRGHGLRAGRPHRDFHTNVPCGLSQTSVGLNMLIFDAYQLPTAFIVFTLFALNMRRGGAMWVVSIRFAEEGLAPPERKRKLFLRDNTAQCCRFIAFGRAALVSWCAVSQPYSSVNEEV